MMQSQEGCVCYPGTGVSRIPLPGCLHNFAQPPQQDQELVQDSLAKSKTAENPEQVL